MADSKFDIGINQKEIELWDVFEYDTYMNSFGEGKHLSAVMLELDKDIINHDRSVYTYFDLFGDLGGLKGSLDGFAHVLILFINIFWPNTLITGIMQKLFNY